MPIGPALLSGAEGWLLGHATDSRCGVKGVDDAPDAPVVIDAETEVGAQVHKVASACGVRG